MLRLLLAASLVVAGEVSAQARDDTCDFGTADPEAPAQIEQFAFLIGHHEIALHAWQGENWTPPRPARARWNGRYGLDGMAIVDEWFDPGPTNGQTDIRGINVRMYDADQGLWKLMWISSATHQIQQLRAEVRDGVLTMWQVHPERPG